MTSSNVIDLTVQNWRPEIILSAGTVLSCSCYNRQNAVLDLLFTDTSFIFSLTLNKKKIMTYEHEGTLIKEESVIRSILNWRAGKVVNQAPILLNDCIYMYFFYKLCGCIVLNKDQCVLCMKIKIYMCIYHIYTYIHSKCHFHMHTILLSIKRLLSSWKDVHIISGIIHIFWYPEKLNELRNLKSIYGNKIVNIRKRLNKSIEYRWVIFCRKTWVSFL